ncbi:cystatin isoform X2 [Gallus gallus]|uniref:cystatin isoform X2 n=1 Tax=Gallus gallus TaxID=9031 RepID=UPI001F020216|nr:cystatin isoform X2 [Gallus gallus]
MRAPANTTHTPPAPGGALPFACSSGGGWLSNRRASRGVIDGRRVPAGQWWRAVCEGGGITCPKVCARGGGRPEGSSDGGATGAKGLRVVVREAAVVRRAQGERAGKLRRRRRERGRGEGTGSAAREEELVSGIKYILQVEIGRTTCPKSSGDLQSCEFHDEPEMAKYTTCTFVVYSIPWLNQIKLLESKCQ